MDLFKSYAIAITPSGGSRVVIGGITQQSLVSQTTQNATVTAGSPYAFHGEITQASPMGRFTTLQIGKAIDAMGLEGACLAGVALPGFEMWELRHERCGKLASGTVHRKFIIPNGIALIRSISVGHRQDATAFCEVLSTYDGTNDPVIISEGEAAPTGLTDNERFALGPITIASHAIEGNLSAEINFGNATQTDGGDSEPFDTHVEVPEIIPITNVRSRDVAKFSNSVIPLRGLQGTHLNTSIVLRRWVNGTAGFSADPDSIEITQNAMVNFDEAFSTQANRRGEASIQMTALNDSTNSPLVFDTAFAA